MDADRLARAMRRLERALVVAGVVCLGYYGYQRAEAGSFQREQAAAFDATRQWAPSASPTLRVLSAPSASEVKALAILEIPRLSLSSPVISGDSDDVLDVAIGHLPDTPKPWELGNSALAAHRDGLFRSLRRIRVGDAVRVRSPYGDLTYRVRATRVVQPDDLSVLAPTDGHTLTLITCYPFNFIGRAPQRFIVQADRVGSAGSTQ